MLTLAQFRETFGVPVFAREPYRPHRLLKLTEPIPDAVTVFLADCPGWPQRMTPTVDLWHLADYAVTASVSGPAYNLTRRTNA